MKKSTLLLVSASLLAFSGISADARTWTRASDGKTIEGEFVRMKDANIVYILREGGQTIEVPVASLSAEDQSFLKEQASGQSKPQLPEGETSVTLAGVHLCCGGCRTGVQSAVSGMEGLELSFETGKVLLKGGSGELVKKAIDAIAAAGYYGTSDHEVVKVDDIFAKADEKASDKVTVSGVHLCCGKCVTAIDDIVAAIDGAKEHDAKRNAPTFTIAGEGLKPSMVLAALRAEGFNATVE